MTKILLIDDNQAVLNFLRILLLQKDQYEVETLQDSTKAYDLIEQGRFDVLILDMDMPNVSGLDILKYIQKNKIVLKHQVGINTDEINIECIITNYLRNYCMMASSQEPIHIVQCFLPSQ